MMFKKNPISVVTCGPLHMPQNGGITYSISSYGNGQHPLGTETSFSCNYGFSQSGRSLRTSTIPGQWTFSNPTCTQSKGSNISPSKVL